MIDMYEDQAAGMRRLFRQTPPSVLALYTTGHKRRLLALETATRLAGKNQKVLVLDEAGPDACLGQDAGGQDLDLLHTLDTRYAPSSVVQSLRPRIARLRTAAAAMALPLLDEARRARLLEALQVVTRNVGFVLIHGDLHQAGVPSPFAYAAPRRLLVAEATGRGATEAYNAIKQLAGAGAGSLHVLVARARSRGDAWAFFKTLDDLVQRHIGVPLVWLGELERDAIEEGLTQPVNLHPQGELEEAFMRKLAAWGRSAGLMSAVR
jgi:flagellar biosynthesis protein FlhG